MMWKTGFPWKALLALATPAMLALAACTPPGRSAAGEPPPAYALNGGDGTVSALDSWAGHAGRVALDTRARPTAIAAGPHGSLLFLAPGMSQSATAAGAAELAGGSKASGLVLLQMLPGVDRGTARQIPIDATVRDGVLAAAGGRYAAVVSRVPANDEVGDSSAPGCSLVVVDLAAGAVVYRRPLCGVRQVAGGLAIGDPGDGSGRTVVYAGVWTYAAGPDVDPWTPGGQIVALDAATGAAIASARTATTPTQLAFAKAPGGDGWRLYVLEGDSGIDESSAGALWRLTGFDPLTLHPESATPIEGDVSRLSVTPDGRMAYALSAAGRTLMALDLVGGGQRSLPLPDWGQDVLATQDRIYVANVYGSSVWVVDRRNGHLGAIATGPHPIALAFPTT